MAPIYLILALIIQCSFLRADTGTPEETQDLRETLVKPDIDNEENKILSNNLLDTNWVDMFTLSNSNSMYPTPTAAMMAQVANSNKTAEEQVNDIQELTKVICAALEGEMMEMLAFAIANTEKQEEGSRKKRSIQTPMDSTEMVMRLLRHIKSNNEHQNIAIDKMMSAQEIADKFGIEFNPDPEILSDLAIAANEHAQEITNLLKDACILKNITTEEVNFIPLVDEPKKENDTYYIYGVHPEGLSFDNNGPSFEYVPDIVSKPQSVNHIHHSEQLPYFNYPYESQISSPPVHHHSAPISSKSSFYDPFMYPFTPASDFYTPYCSVEPLVPILIPVDDSEPELVGEEVEETITTKMIVEKGEEPGTTTVNQVTSYVITEKSHYKPPQIEQLPQHFQYCFFLL